MLDERPTGWTVDPGRIPDQFPTHRHEAAFWESLGRAVATFGFLEEVLGKAIFAFTATRPYGEAEIEQAYAEWLPKLERALIDPLGGLTDTYGETVRAHPHATVSNLDLLLDDLRKAKMTRDILCHGSWGLPDARGSSIPFFMNRKRMVVTSAMNKESIDQVQRHVTELACAIVGTVTHMGWQFPGSAGPGKPIW